MRSFMRKVDNRRKIYLNLVSALEGQLRDAYAKRHDEKGETQADLARRLDVHRSVINRRLTGKTNMTVETIADMVWALGHCIKVDIYDPEETRTNHLSIAPVHPPATHRISRISPNASHSDRDTPSTRAASVVKVRQKVPA